MGNTSNGTPEKDPYNWLLWWGLLTVAMGLALALWSCGIHAANLSTGYLLTTSPPQFTNTGC